MSGHETNSAAIADLLERCRSHVHHDPAAALRVALEAEGVADAAGAAEALVEVWLVQGSACLFLGDLDGARARIERLEGATLDPVQGAMLARLRASHAQRTGNLPQALSLALDALQVLGPTRAEADDDHVRVTTSLHNLAGNVLAQLADFAGAIEHHLHAVSLQERLGGSARHEFLGILHNNVGMSYRELRHFGEAEEAFQRALRTFGEGRSYTRAVVLGNLGLIRCEADRAQEALAPLREALALCIDLEHPRGMGTMHHNLGVALHAVGEGNAAETAFREALAVRTRVGEALDTLETQVRLASMLADRERDSEAEALVAQLLGTPAAASWHQRRADAHHVLYRLHRRRKDFERALEHHEAFLAASLALRDDRAQSRFQALSARFRTEELAREREAQRVRGDELARLSRTDALTGIANRRSLDAYLADTFRTLGDDEAFTLAVLDVDAFKSVNDRYTHAVGDRALREVANVVTRHLRHGDTLARYGGEEFVVCFPAAGIEAGVGACERLRAAIAAHDWTCVAEGLALTVSFGVAERRAGDTPEALFARADAALYRAKASGRNRVERASEA